MLLGVYQVKGTRAVVRQVVEMENVEPSATQFAINPEREYQVLEAAAQAGLDLVGIFHSHPAPPHPSARDLQFMEYNPCPWVIDGVQGLRHMLKAYQMIDGCLHNVAIQITG
jgi:proteasome lid subunit RPN8/RPN11